MSGGGDDVGTLMVTELVSASAPPACTAMMRNVPAVCPAVNVPPLVMVPPVAENAGITAAVLPSLRLPDTENCWEDPGVSDTDAGVSTMLVIGGSETVTVAVSAKPVLLCVTTTR